MAHIVWDGFIQIGGVRGRIIRRLVSQRPWGPRGSDEAFIIGSNDEKISVNIWACGWVV